MSAHATSRISMPTARSFFGAAIVLALSGCASSPTASERPVPTSRAVPRAETVGPPRPATCDELVRQGSSELQRDPAAFPTSPNGASDVARKKGAKLLAEGAFSDAADQFLIAQRDDPTDLTSATFERAARFAFDESQSETAERIALVDPIVVADISLVPSFKTSDRMELRPFTGGRGRATTKPNVVFDGQFVSGAEDQPPKFRNAQFSAAHRGPDHRTLTYGDRWVIVETDEVTRVFDVQAVVPKGVGIHRAVRHGGLVVVEASTGLGEHAFGGLLFAFREATGELVWKSRLHVANVRSVVVSGDLAIVGFSEDMDSGKVSAIDLNTGSTRFEVPVPSRVSGLRQDGAAIVVETDGGDFSVYVGGAQATAPEVTSFVRRTSVQASMANASCAVNRLARATDARDAGEVRAATEWLDALVAPRGLLRAAKGAASLLERSAKGPSIDVYAETPKVIAFKTATTPSPGPPCAPASLSVTWTEGDDLVEADRRRASFGITSSEEDSFEFLRTPRHAIAPTSFGDEVLRLVRRRTDGETLVYGDRYVFGLSAEAIVGSFDIGQSAHGQTPPAHRVVDALVIGDTVVLVTSSNETSKRSLAGFDVRSGALRWRRPIAVFSPVALDGRIIAIGYDESNQTQVIVLCPTDGRELTRSRQQYAESLVARERLVFVRRAGQDVELELE